MQKFPILAVVKEALRMPFGKPVDLLKGVLLIGIPFAVMFVAGQQFQAKTQMAMKAAKAGQHVEPAGMGLLVLVMLVSLVAFFWAVAYIFNHWVRAGAYGVDAAAMRPLSKAWGRAGVTMIKFLLISLLLGIALMICWFVLYQVGVAPSISELMQMAEKHDVRGATRAGVSLNVIFTIITCFIYSNFSANLTQTALVSKKEGLEHPHTVDFAIVLLLLYALVLIPGILLGFAGVELARTVIVYLLDFYIMFAIAAAHGLRYRICVAEMPDVPEAQEA